MKKFKEMISTCITLPFIGLGIGMCMRYIMIGATKQFIISLILVILMTLMMLFRFKIFLDQDYMVVYVWRYVGMVPMLIDYCDIKSVTQLSKHKIRIEHRTTSTIYLFNADGFMDSYEELKKAYDQKVS